MSSPLKTCPRCAAGAPPEASFCSSCGLAFSAAAAGTLRSPEMRRDGPLAGYESVRETPEEISCSYTSTIVLRRWAGAWIDLFVVALIIYGPMAALGDHAWGETVLLWLGLASAYFPVTEGYTGRTLGKWITRTKVVDAAGRTPGLGKAVIRSLTRVIEVNPMLAGGAPAGLAVIATKTHQRIGDMLAGTFVIKNEDLHRLESPEAGAEW
jgi:uncharacterized RDD family membrane protein YckC